MMNKETFANEVLKLVTTELGCGYHVDVRKVLNKKVSSTHQLPCPSFLRGGLFFVFFLRYFTYEYSAANF